MLFTREGFYGSGFHFGTLRGWFSWGIETVCKNGMIDA